ncbi:alpha-1,2-fucosyltransferase [Pedobacter metabolipauper]|uniref:Glycosyl transferase family 11 n=1 Tax=Pedobacter metabolipauper TaxID=425513 RepID=A0A4R6T0U8_9SPHI|nr:alpha-1,2-fucosyltransferase [Pedobacter metabolipauper]TDQ12005.1 glycosyl transferase family 11 [Pedobacter metabolipauper]
MVGIKFIGRLGNQIFQYAFFQYLKTNNPRQSFFFVNPHHGYLTKYFELEPFQNLTLGSKAYSVYARIIPKIIGFKEIYIESIQVPKKVDVRNWTIYKGFFQTDFYVKNIIGNFKINIKKEFTDQFELEFGELFRTRKTVVVHIRRTDYLNYGKRDISLPMEYFKKRLNDLGNIDDHSVFFVSDDIEYVKDYFKEQSNYIFSSNNEITDFQIIKNADIAIISNSSFAWWAAYLSEKDNKVYAPKNWLGFRIGKEHPKKVMTDKFTWCTVID